MFYSHIVKPLVTGLEPKGNKLGVRFDLCLCAKSVKGNVVIDASSCLSAGA